MAEEQKPETAQQQPGAEAEREGEPTTDAEERASESGGDWPELETYRERLRSEHAEWSERVTAVQNQLAAVQAALLDIAAQYHALGIEEDLERLNRQILGGTGMAQSLRLGYDLERYVALFWPVAADPRPTLMRPEGEGEYRIEVYLHLGPDGRGRIRVEGAKRLEAPLPTSRARLRSVLLSAIQSPKLVERAGDVSDEGEGPPATEGEPPSADQGEAQRADAATPRPGDASEQPPPEEQVIPLGPAEDTEPPPEKPKRRRKS